MYHGLFIQLCLFFCKRNKVTFYFPDCVSPVASSNCRKITSPLSANVTPALIPPSVTLLFHPLAPAGEVCPVLAHGHGARHGLPRHRLPGHLVVRGRKILLHNPSAAAPECTRESHTHTLFVCQCRKVTLIYFFP